MTEQPRMYFDTLSNTHPIPRRGERKSKDPRNDKDYDTFDYGTEPLPFDRTWACKKAGMTPTPNQWKGQIG